MGMKAERSDPRKRKMIRATMTSVITRVWVTSLMALSMYFVAS